MSSPNDTRWQHRFRRLLFFAGTATSFYLLSSYILDRLREARAKAIKEKMQKDLIRGHFQSLSNTISFTLYALLPTLQPQLESAYPVESISQALQGRSSGSIEGSSLGGSVQPTPESSVVLQDTLRSPRSEAPQEPHEPLGPVVGTADEHVGESWASEFKAGTRAHDVDPASPTQASVDGSLLHAPSGDEASSTMSHSFSLAPTDASSSSASPPSDLSHSALLHPSPPRQSVDLAADQLAGKSKKELWRELKLQTLTRSLTTAYLLPLLYLLTTSQLATLARIRYLEDVKRSNNPDQSIDDALEDARATRMQGKSGWLGYFSIPSMGLGDLIESATPSIIQNPRAYIPTTLNNWIPSLPSLPFVSSETRAASDADVLVSAVMRDRQAQLEADKMEDEKTYLTYSWWILHEGWRHLAKRVEEGVEDVFGGVGLKANMEVVQWQELLREVRARIETVNTDGTASLYSFTDHILPPSPLPDLVSSDPCPLPTFPASNRPHLAYLHAQTTSHLSSPDANYLIEKGVSTMTQNLLHAIEAGLPPPGGRARLVDSLPAVSRWSKNVWEGIPDSGVEGLLALPEYEGFAALVFGDWAPVE